MIWAVVGVFVTPWVIGYIWSLRYPHRPEYDTIGMWDGVGK